MSYLKNVVYKTWSREILNTLLLPRQQPGFNEYLILLIGERGSGKTTLCRALEYELKNRGEIVEYLAPAKMKKILSQKKSLVDYLEELRNGRSITVIFDDIIEFMNQFEKQNQVASEIFGLLKKSAELEDENKDERIVVVLVVQKSQLEVFMNNIGEEVMNNIPSREVWERILVTGDLHEILNNMYNRVQEARSIDDTLIYMHHSRRSVIVDLDLLWNKVRYDEKALVGNIDAILSEIGLQYSDHEKNKVIELIKLYLRTLPVETDKISAKGFGTVQILKEGLTGEGLSDAVRKFTQINPLDYAVLYDELVKLSGLRTLPSRTIIDAFYLYFMQKSKYTPVINARINIPAEGETVGAILDLALFKEKDSPGLIVHIARPKEQSSGSTNRRYTYMSERTRKIIKIAKLTQSKLIVFSEKDDIIERLYADIGRLSLDKAMYRVIDLNKLNEEEKKWIALSSIVKSGKNSIINVWLDGFINILIRLGIYEFLKE